MRPGQGAAALVELRRCAAASAAAQPAPPPAGRPRSLALNQATATLKAGGLVAAEVRAGSVRYLEAGHPEPRPGIPPERLVFEIGSVTKVFTGLLLAQAVVENRVRLTDTLGQVAAGIGAAGPEGGGDHLEELATRTFGAARPLAERGRAEDYGPVSGSGTSTRFSRRSIRRPRRPPRRSTPI